MAASRSRWRLRRDSPPRSLRRLLDSVSGRLLVLILLSVVPLAVLASLTAWHTYRSTVEVSSSRAAMLAEALKARSDQQIADTERVLRALSQRPELADVAACSSLLRLVRGLQTVPLARLSLLDASGRLACGSPAPAIGDVAYPRKLESLQTLPDGDGLTSRPILRLTVASGGPAGAGMLVADMPLGWSRAELARSDILHPWLGRRGGTGAWLVTPDGRAVSLCSDCGWSPPALHAAEAAQLGHTAPGRVLKPDMVGNLALLVTTQSTEQEGRALSTFLWHVLAIALLLAAGLVAVMIGAAVLIVRPLRDVTLSVTEWQRAGAYDPRHTRSTPIELRQLSRTFAHATRALAAHEERLRRSESNQELLIKEIHHRVKNNLQIIASLLNLQANRIRQPEARAEFASARDRVRALATLHRHLYSEGELHTLNMRPFLRELCGQLFQAIGEKEGGRIRLEIEAPEIVMSTDQAVPLSLVVTEAVSNAIKYAFPGGRSGRVTVRLTEDVEGIATLVIDDDGIGIPAGRAETETGIRDGLGIQLIRGFARQLGATLEVLEGEPDADGRSEGTRYTLLVPLNPKVETYADSPDAAREALETAAPHA